MDSARTRAEPSIGEPQRLDQTTDPTGLRLAPIQVATDDLEQLEEQRLSRATRLAARLDQRVQTRLAPAVRRLAVETVDPLALRLTPEVLDRSELPIELEEPQPHQIVAADPLVARIELEATQPRQIVAADLLVARIEHEATQLLLIENEARLVAPIEHKATQPLQIESEVRLVTQTEREETRLLLIENEARLVAPIDHVEIRILPHAEVDRLVAPTALAVTQLLHPTRVVEAIRTTDERVTETRL